MSYNVAEYIIGWGFNGLHDGEIIAYLFQTVFVRSSNEAFKRTSTQTHTHTHIYIYIYICIYTRAHGHTSTNAIDENTIRLISFKNQTIF